MQLLALGSPLLCDIFVGTRTLFVCTCMPLCLPFVMGRCDYGIRCELYLHLQ